MPRILRSRAGCPSPIGSGVATSDREEDAMRIVAISGMWLAAFIGAGALAAGCANEKVGSVAGLTDAELQAEVGDSSAFQRALLSDGVLTYAEYETAVLATVQCLRDRGVSIVTEPHAAPGNVIAFEFGGSTQFSGEASDRENEEARLAYEDCYHEHQDVVDLAWARQNQVDQRTLEGARAALRRCLHEAGIEGVPENAKGRDFQPFQHFEAFPRCQDSVAREFNIAGFGG